MVAKQNKQKDSKSHVPFRLNLLFFIIFVLFAILIIQLGFLQIIRGEDFKAEVQRTESTIIQGNVPRGEIYDAHLKKIVGNEATNAIIYTRGKNTEAKTMATTASRLSKIISLPHVTELENEEKKDLTIRDLKDYYFAAHQEEMEERIENYVHKNKINSNNFDYEDQLELIKESDLERMHDEELNAAAIYKKMNSAYALSAVNIKNKDVTSEEMAAVAENAEYLPGVNTSTDWERVYPLDDMLRSVLGTVSTEKQGLPESQLNAYLAKGYSRNDRVGTSLIELQYEDVLRGTKSRLQTEVNASGDIIKQVERYAGEKGDNLVLTIDTEIQKRFDEVALNTLAQRQGLNDSVYITAINPKNGDIIAMSGKKIVKGEIEDDALGVFQNSFTMGSSVKPATVLSGYLDGVISVDNNVIVDMPLQFQGSENISSVYNRHGVKYLSDIQALAESSNVYMAMLAMRMGGYYDYKPNEFLPIDAEETIAKMRKYNRQFGLGSPTGIDLPNESIGQPGEVTNAGQALFNAFGQFDTYTPLQHAQYAATIANGGIRYAPRLVREIRGTNPDTGELGALKTKIEPKILNEINVSKEAFNRVHQSMWQVANGSLGLTPAVFRGAPYTFAGKTGTAEAYYWGENESMRGTPVYNMTFIGFAPYDDPEIAVSVVVPYLPSGYLGTIHVETIRNAMDAYFGVGRFGSHTSSDE
ncbi:peptidoglycan D,D-transpeptidase FtsI family protein [Allofustis seminis]|uniref:peptidoglycan D,D-transpeptidase FtsI family protein n=1 Tax=Allofustis seminis TaxID=166939 RepID=UPI00036EBCE4|nr:penicillin-binding protein 2 [Allofustis seminis]